MIHNSEPLHNNNRHFLSNSNQFNRYYKALADSKFISNSKHKKSPEVRGLVQYFLKQTMEEQHLISHQKLGLLSFRQQQSQPMAQE